MLRWEEDKNGWSAYDDARIYRVIYTEENGWEYQYLLDDSLDGMDGYDTAEEAKAGAEADFAAHQIELELDELEPLTLEEEEDFWDTYWDTVAHEQMETAKGLF